MEKPVNDSTAWRRELRLEMQQKRSAMTDGERLVATRAIVRHLQQQFAAPGVCAFCWPIRHEPDVRAVVESWRAAGTHVALPVVLAPDAPLAFRAWDGHSPLLPDRYGIPTPVSGPWLVPDMILLPLNGFDAAGYRLGYGGGYFDRTLAALVPRPLAVGVGYEINRIETIRPERHDQRLDWVVTDAAVRCFRQSSDDPGSCGTPRSYASGRS